MARAIARLANLPDFAVFPRRYAVTALRMRLRMSRIRYMGNKHLLAPDVVELASSLERKATLVDVFCGMGSVGRGFSSSGWPVWGNDVQEYAALAGRCYLAGSASPATVQRLRSILRPSFVRNRRSLRSRFQSDLMSEQHALRLASQAEYQKLYAAWRHAANNGDVAREVADLAQTPSDPYRLATLCYAWGYFGLEQSIELDSLRFAIDDCLRRGLLLPGEAEWAKLAVLETASTISASPGHFAQYLGANSVSGFARIRRQRVRSVWRTFLVSCDQQEAYGDEQWRSKNEVFCDDALTVWSRPQLRALDRAVVYADPPYSKDHYSRFYHVLETLLLYDYPTVVGKGRYREHRFATPFSIKRLAPQAFTDLFQRVAERKWSLVLSYPSNGLLPCDSVEELLRTHFRKVELPVRRTVAHSTLGAKHGSAAKRVEELMWTAR